MVTLSRITGFAVIAALGGLILILSISGGCGSGGKGAAGGGGGNGGNGVQVGSSGGIVAMNGVTVDVPAGAISSGTAVIKAVLEDGLPSPAPGGSIQAGKTVVLTVSGIDRFDKPVSVTVPYDAALVGPQDVPVVVHWDESSQVYHPVTMIGIYAQNHTVTFSTLHFSKFGIIIPEETSILTAADSGFRPEIDGFFHSNFGGYYDPGGWCMGFATYAAWYYTTKSDEGKIPQAETALHFMYRNMPENPDPVCSSCDPMEWVDDPTAREVVSWSAPWKYGVFAEMQQSQDLSDEADLKAMLTYFKILRSPLILILVPSSTPEGEKTVGHAVVAYRYEPPSDGRFSTAEGGRGRLYVYDSNICDPDGCLPAIFDFGVDPNDPSGPLKFFNYSEDASYIVSAVFSLDSITVPDVLETIYQKAKTGWSASESTYVSMYVDSAFDGEGHALDVSAGGGISILKPGPITINSVIDTAGSTVLGTPKFIPSYVRVWLDGEPLSVEDVLITDTGTFTIHVPEQTGKTEFVLWLVAHDGGDQWDAWQAYAGFKRVEVTTKPVDIDIYLSREGSKVLCPGRTVKLVAEVVDGNTGLPYTGCAVEWSSSNSEIASVLGGVVTAGIPGRASVTASCGGAKRTASIKVVQHDPLTGQLGHGCFLVTVTDMTLDPNYLGGESCSLVGSEGAAPVSGRSLGITGYGGSYNVVRPVGAAIGAENGNATFYYEQREEFEGLDMFTESFNPYYPDDYAHLYNIRRIWAADLREDMCELSGYYDWDFYGPVDSCAGRNSVTLTPVDFLVEGGAPFYLCE